MTPEGLVQRACFEWLGYQQSRGFFFRVNNGAVYDKKRECYRKPGFGHVDGIPDALGIWCHKPTAIEFKAPGGRQSDEQKQFEARWVKQGGVYVLADSLDALLGPLQGSGRLPSRGL